MTDTKDKVKKSAKQAMDDALSVAGNNDIAPVLEDLVNCIMKPTQVRAVLKCFTKQDLGTADKNYKYIYFF